MADAGARHSNVLGREGTGDGSVQSQLAAMMNSTSTLDQDRLGATDQFDEIIASGGFSSEEAVQIEKTSDEPRKPFKPWLYFGITKTVGTDPGAVEQALESDLSRAGYYTVKIRMSDLVISGWEYVMPEADIRKRREELVGNLRLYHHLMGSGDTLRMILSSSIVAELAIRSIKESRRADLERAFSSGKSGVAYLILSFLHPAEVALFRATYGSRFFLIAVSAPEEKRKANIRRRFATDPIPNGTVESVETYIQGILNVDRGIDSFNPVPVQFRLNVDKTFSQSDAFCTVDMNSTGADLNLSARDKWSVTTIHRLIRQIFNYPFGTITENERAMTSAYTASRKSMALGRSVGAALVQPVFPPGSSSKREEASNIPPFPPSNEIEYRVIATGFNDVARPGGGYYRGEPPSQGERSLSREHGDIHNGMDPSDLQRLLMARHFVASVFRPAAWAAEIEELGISSESSSWIGYFKGFVEKYGPPPIDIVSAWPKCSDIGDQRLWNLIEFGRTVHAEMAAIIRGMETLDREVPLDLYVTTFPCHECTRAIIYSGARRVFYIEPYDKSMWKQLYATEVTVFGEEPPTPQSFESTVKFEPFSGMSPLRIPELFSPVKRKHGIGDAGPLNLDKVGKSVPWTLEQSTLRETVLCYGVGTTEYSESGFADYGLEQLLYQREDPVVHRLQERLDAKKEIYKGVSGIQFDDR